MRSLFLCLFFPVFLNEFVLVFCWNCLNIFWNLLYIIFYYFVVVVVFNIGRFVFELLDSLLLLLSSFFKNYFFYFLIFF